MEGEERTAPIEPHPEAGSTAAAEDVPTWRDLTLSHAQFKREYSRSHVSKSPSPGPLISPSGDVSEAVSRFAANYGLDEGEHALLEEYVRDFHRQRYDCWLYSSEPAPKRPWDSDLLLRVLNICEKAPFSTRAPPPGSTERSRPDPRTTPPSSEPFVNLAPVPETTAPKPFVEASFTYEGPIGWFRAEQLFVKETRVRWLNFIDRTLPSWAQQLEDAWKNPSGTPERRIRPHEVVFEFAEFVAWAKAVDSEEEQVLFHFEIEERWDKDASQFGLMARKMDFGDARTEGFNGPFIDREMSSQDPSLPAPFRDQEMIFWGTFGVSVKSESEAGMIFNAPLASAMRSLSELHEINEKEVRKGFRVRKRWFPHRAPLYIAAMGAAWSTWKKAARMTADFGSPRNMQLASSGRPFSPNQGTDPHDHSAYPEHPWVHISLVIPNVVLLVDAADWIAARDPSLGERFAVVGYATDISAYFRFIHKRRRDSWRQSVLCAQPPSEGRKAEARFFDSDATQFGESDAMTIAQRCANGATAVVRKFGWQLEQLIERLAQDPSSVHYRCACRLRPLALREWIEHRRKLFGRSGEHSPIAQDVCFFTEQCVDDRFGCSLGRFRGAAHLFIAVYTFELPGLKTNEDKTQGGYDLDLLGLALYFSYRIVALTPFKRQLLVDWAWRIVSRSVVEHDETESFVGFLQYACITKPPAALFLRRIYQFLHVVKCWSFLRGVPGLAHEWRKGSHWFRDDINSAVTLILRADGIILLKIQRNPRESLYIELASDANRNHKKLDKWSGAGGVICIQRLFVFSWSFRFARKYVLSLPVHVLECALLPVQEKLFASWFARASEADEWCDNESTCIAANERKPKDPRLLLFILERVDLLDLAGDPQGPVRRLSHLRSEDNPYADFMSRGRVEPAIQQLKDDGFIHLQHFHLEQHACWPFVVNLLDRAVALTESMTDPARFLDRW